MLKKVVVVVVIFVIFFIHASIIQSSMKQTNHRMSYILLHLDHYAMEYIYKRVKIYQRPFVIIMVIKYYKNAI